MDFNYQNLKKVRKAANLSVYRLARMSGLSESAISLIEHNQREARVNTIKKYLKALDKKLMIVDKDEPKKS